MEAVPAADLLGRLVGSCGLLLLIRCGGGGVTEGGRGKGKGRLCGLP